MTVATIVAEPSTVGELQDVVKATAARGGSLRVRGRGTWLDAGRPVRATDAVSTRALAGIVAYVPGDLTLTARAGTTLADIRAATAEHGQWLALDPAAGDEGTIGATVATASAGPLATAFGTPRDLVLGAEFVLGTGEVARGGGRVVKNVAGFDLTRLFTGSWGTLGVITEVTVRLHARPECDESYAVAFDGEGAAARVRKALRRLPFTPYACELVNATLAAGLVGTEQTTAVFRLGGNAESVRAQHAALAALGDARRIDDNLWDRLRDAERAPSMVVRLSGPASELARTWSAASAIAAACAGTYLHAAPARGVVRCIVPGGGAESLARVLRDTGVTRVAERLPAELWAVVAPPPTGDLLSVGIKRAFDPHGVLNAGIFGELS